MRDVFKMLWYALLCGILGLLCAMMLHCLKRPIHPSEREPKKEKP